MSTECRASARTGANAMNRKTAPLLGELEVAVLERLWSVGHLTAKEAHDALGEPRGISLNTVQSTLDRLNRKQILTRKKEARAFRYFPRQTREALIAHMIGDLVDRLGGKQPITSLAAFISAAENLDASVLKELERLIAERRQQHETGQHD